MILDGHASVFCTVRGCAVSVSESSRVTISSKTETPRTQFAQLLNLPAIHLSAMIQGSRQKDEWQEDDEDDSEQNFRDAATHGNDTNTPELSVVKFAQP